MPKNIYLNCIDKVTDEALWYKACFDDASAFHTSSTIGQVVIKQFLCALEILIVVGTKFLEFPDALNVKISIYKND